MRFPVVVVLALFALGAAMGQQAEQKGQAPQQDLQARIKQLVEQLGDEDFEKREQAMEELVRIGRPALKALKKAATSDDPEVAWRAREALKRILKKRQPSMPEKGPLDRILPPLPKLPPLQDDEFDRWLRQFWEEMERDFKKQLEQFDRHLKELEEARKRFEKRMRDLMKRVPKKAPDKGVERKRGEHTVVIIGPDGKMRIRRYVWRDGRLVEKVEKEVPAPVAVLGADLVPVPQFLRYHLRLKEGQGVMVENLEEDSPLKKAGLQRGDIILAVDGKPVGSQEDFSRAIEEKESVKLTVLQAGRTEEIELKLK